jgi:hypothetical protein
MGARLHCVPIAVLALALSSAPGSSQPKKKNDTKDPGVVSAQDRFSGRVSIGEKAPTATLALQGPNIHYQVLSLAPGIRAAAAPPPNAKIMALPLKGQGGFVIYELRAGKLTTIINGNRQQRREGEFWVVRPGESIELETDDDSVVVQTLQIPGQ